ncbi:MAG TPA: hypothetical protein P5105_00085 [Victivallales bacterium]|nr:hypothetical protein [Victivallales bacterium]HRR05656.1 hypothetical protein [Victivallales bacterium]HRR28499.1 hypothetical protein [Victivallales bacterium]HRU00184.1 hypothetical protein [Victivallales bacterium]
MKKFWGITAIIAVVGLIVGCEDTNARASIDAQSKKIDELTNETMILRSEIQTLKSQIAENNDKISKIALYLKKKEMQASTKSTNIQSPKATQTQQKNNTAKTSPKR